MIRGIAISGKAGAGKSELAWHILRELQKRGVAHQRVAFGDALKQEVRELYGLTKDDPGGREKLIEHGEMMRAGDPLYWINRLFWKLDGAFAVVDDLRFPLEYRFAQGLGFFLVRVEAPCGVRLSRLQANGHGTEIVGSASVTETGLDDAVFEWGATVENRGPLFNCLCCDARRIVDLALAAQDRQRFA